MPANRRPRLASRGAGLCRRRCAAAAEGVTVFAAASLTNALDDVAAAWTAETGHR